MTGVIGKLTAIGRDMNLAARLQSLAGINEIIIGPNCRMLLETYKKEGYLVELPFSIIDKEPAVLKGFDKPVPCYSITAK